MPKTNKKRSKFDLFWCLEKLRDGKKCSLWYSHEVDLKRHISLNHFDSDKLKRGHHHDYFKEADARQERYNQRCGIPGSEHKVVVKKQKVKHKVKAKKVLMLSRLKNHFLLSPAKVPCVQGNRKKVRKDCQSKTRSEQTKTVTWSEERTRRRKKNRADSQNKKEIVKRRARGKLPVQNYKVLENLCKYLPELAQNKTEVPSKRVVYRLLGKKVYGWQPSDKYQGLSNAVKEGKFDGDNINSGPGKNHFLCMFQLRPV